MNQIAISFAMRRMAFVALATESLALIAGCDPAMTIHQAAPKGASQNNVVLVVKPARQLIGDTWYAPQITFINSLQVPVAITGVELSTEKKTYSGTSPQPQPFPRVVPADQSQNLTVLFRLDDDIWKTFRQSTELRVRYRHGDIEDMARAAIEHAPLDDSQ